MNIDTHMSHPANANTAVSVKRMPFSAQQVFAAIRSGALFLHTGVWPTTLEWDFRVGGKYSCEWRMDTLLKGEGEFLEIVENEKVSFTWLEPDGTHSKATVTLTERGSFTKVAIVHTGLSGFAMVADVLGGWDDAIASLEEELRKICLRVERSFSAPVKNVFEAVRKGVLFRACGSDHPSTDSFAEGELRDFTFEIDGEQRVVSIRLVQARENDKLHFTWESAGCGHEKLPSGLTDLIVYFSQSQEKTRLHLLHDGFIDPRVAQMHDEGWNMFIDRFIAESWFKR